MHRTGTAGEVPQPASPSQTDSAAAAAAAGASVAIPTAGTAAAIAGTGAATAAGTLAIGAAAAAILTGLMQFLAALRERHRRFLAAELARYATAPRDIADAIEEEMQRELEFAQNSADRVARQLPAALAIKDRGQRRDAVERILEAERRFAQQRSEAMLARAAAAVQRAQLRRTSPLGAFWRLGFAKNHTPGCLAMADRFWPWVVLDRVHPPRHYGCTASLHGFDEAVAAGWMRPEDVIDPAAAVKAAAGVVMEQEAADALLAELVVRGQLVEQGVPADWLARIPFAGLRGVSTVEGVDDGTVEAVSISA